MERGPLGAASASLDPLETKGGRCEVRDGYEYAETDAATPLPGIHSAYHVRRAVIIRALLDAGDTALVKRAERLRFCVSQPHIRVTHDGTPSLVLARCKDRLCPLCSDLRGRQCATKLTELIKRMNAARFITLTMKNSDAPLREQVDRLFQCFRSLRDTPFWRSKVKGGCYSLEVTWNAKSKTWHPHLHLIVDGEYMPQTALATWWEKLTGDSRVVWIEAVNDAKKAAFYIAKYVNTPPDVHTWGVTRIVEYAVAMHGRRVLHTFGTLHAANADASMKKEAPPASRYVCTVKELVERANAGNDAAQDACKLMVRMGGFWTAIAAPLLPFLEYVAQEISEDERRNFARLCQDAFAEEASLPPDVPDASRDDVPPLFAHQRVHL